MCLHNHVEIKHTLQRDKTEVWDTVVCFYIQTRQYPQTCQEDQFMENQKQVFVWTGMIPFSPVSLFSYILAITKCIVMLIKPHLN